MGREGGDGRPPARPQSSPPFPAQLYETANRFHLLHSLALLAVPHCRRPALVRVSPAPSPASPILSDTPSPDLPPSPGRILALRRRRVLLPPPLLPRPERGPGLQPRCPSRRDPLHPRLGGHGALRHAGGGGPGGRPPPRYLGVRPAARFSPLKGGAPPWPLPLLVELLANRGGACALGSDWAVAGKVVGNGGTRGGRAQ